MTAEQLLQDLEALTHAARIRRMIELGRSAAGDPEIAATLLALRQGDFYQRFLALHSCFGSYDGSHILHVFTDPSRTIRGLAINLATLACDEEQLRQALTVVPRDGRLPLLWKLHHHGYHTLIDNFLEHLAAENDLQLQNLLPIGSPTLVRRFIARFQQTMRLVDWRRLARRHPAIAFELLHARAESTTTLDLQLLSFINGILPILANTQPDLAIALVRALARSASPSRINLQALILRRPLEVADLMIQAGGEGLVEISFEKIALRLDEAHLVALLETSPSYLQFSYIWEFRRNAARLSFTFYNTFIQIWHARNICIPLPIVTHLPRAQRELEGRRHLALPALATEPEERLPYAAFLPWDEAHSILHPFLHNPHNKLRTIALTALTRCVRYERECLPDLLSIIHAHLNEPDPVRGAILHELAQLPRSIWRLNHLQEIEQILDTMLNAFDTSPFTVGASALLLTRLLALAPQWSATKFASVLQAHGLTFLDFTFHYESMISPLSIVEIRMLGSALRPVLLSWAQNKNEEAFKEALSLFGKRVSVLDELIEALELLLNQGVSFESGNTILSTLIKYRPERAAQLIPSLLQQDRNWITYPAVSTYLHQRRQDLLTPFLSQRKYSKVFNIPRKPWQKPKPLTQGFSHWTSRQQAIFARTLLKEIHDEANDQPTIIHAITQLAALPAIPIRHLTTLTNSQHPLIRDTALIRLPRFDTAQGIPLLLQALHDQHAVRALYALRPFLLTIPVREALTILRSVPLTKVTIGKEVVRLLGTLPGEEAYQELLALDGQDLHHDVRIALLGALWYHLERDETWHILEREVCSSDPVIALSTVRMSIDNQQARNYRTRQRFWRRRQDNPFLVPGLSWLAEWNYLTMASLSGEHLSFKAQQRLMHLYARLLDEPEITVQAAVLRGCTRLAAADEGQLLLSRLLAAMDSHNEEICTAAARAVFGTCIASDTPLIGQAIAQLLPHRQALQAALHVLEEALFAQKRQLFPVVRAMLEVLASDPVTIELRIELAITLLPWDEVATLLEAAVASGELHAEAVNRACEMLGWSIGGYRIIGRPDVKEMIHLEERLAASPDERLRRIALAALITQSELPQSWSDGLRARLEIYRADPSVLVRAAAQFTFPPDKAE